MLAQAPHHLAARALHALGHVAHLPALLELGPQRLDLLVDGRAAGALRGRRVVVLGEGLLQRLGLLGLELLELLGDAGLDLDLREAGAGCVGLRTAAVSSGRSGRFIAGQLDGMGVCAPRGWTAATRRGRGRLL